VYLAAFAITRHRFDAEGMAQDTFLKAFRALATFRQESRFSTWLERIAVNEAHMHLRHRRKYKSDTRNEDDTDGQEYAPFLLSDWREIPSEALERKEMQQIVRRALLQLPQTCREVLILRDIRQLSIAQTAEVLGLTIADVKTRLLRVRLRDLIAPIQQRFTITSRNELRKGRKPW
jgi:RNA polymerase sigma-70 factor, ECF subfamily